MSVEINPAGGNPGMSRDTHQSPDSGQAMWNTLRPTRPTDSPIVPENATMTFTVGLNQFDSLSESLSLREWSKPGICSRRTAIIASGELQVSSPGSSGFELRSFPVLFYKIPEQRRRCVHCVDSLNSSALHSELGSVRDMGLVWGDARNSPKANGRERPNSLWVACGMRQQKRTENKLEKIGPSSREK
jgi:hypothetical protein